MSIDPPRASRRLPSPTVTDTALKTLETKRGGTPRLLRIGVVGCGTVAFTGALPGLSAPGSKRAAEAAPFLRFDGTPHVTIALVADVEGKRARDAARHFGAEHATVGDAADVLADLGLDGVVICTPPATLV